MKTIRKKFRSVITRLISIDGKPKQIAYGYALGIFLAATPLVGLKAVIAVFLTQLFRWKKIAAIIGVFHVNCFTAPFYYAASFFLGKSVMGYDCAFDFSNNFGISTFLACLSGGKEILISLTVGGLMIGIPLAFLAYKLTLYLISRRKPVEEASGKYALVTGASQGLGRDIAFELAGRKHNLLLVSLKGEGLEVLAEEIRIKYGVDVQFMETDLCESDAVYRVSEWAGQYAVDTLINNAGTGGTRAFETCQPEYIERIILLNCRATSMLTRLMLPGLKLCPKAWIMNVSSLLSYSPIPYKTVYSASKSFIRVFTQSLSEELKNTNVLVSILNPGHMMTNPDVTRRILEQGALGKIGLVKTHRMAKVAISKLFRNNTNIMPGLMNKINRLIMQILPLKVKLRFFSNIYKNELHLNAA